MSSGNKRTGQAILACICCPSTSSGTPECINAVKRPKLSEDTCEVSAMESVHSDSVGDEMAVDESETERYKTLINNFWDKYIPFDQDPDPYELREGYEPTNPLYPDRRWQRRVEGNQVASENPYPQAIASGDRAWWRGEVPFPMVIEAADYTQDKMMDWFIDEQEHRDDWDAKTESDCACVTSFDESVADISDLSDLSSDEEFDIN